AADVDGVALTQVVLRPDQRERLDDEGVVTEAAVQVERGEVVEDPEDVLAGSAIGGEVEGHTVREEAAGGLERGEVVLVAHAGGDVAAGLVDLSELELAVAGAA